MDSPGIRSNTPSAFSDLRAGLARAGGHQHIRFSDREGLHTHPRLQASMVDFLAFFGNKEALRERAQMRANAVDTIKRAIDRDCPGMAERAFERAHLSHAGPGRQITKAELKVLDKEIETLKRENDEVAPRLGGKTVRNLIFSGLEDGCLPPTRGLPTDEMAQLEENMSAVVREQPPGTSAAQCKRAAQREMLAFDLNPRLPTADRSKLMEQQKLLGKVLNELCTGKLQHVPLGEAGKLLRAHLDDTEKGLPPERELMEQLSVLK